ncbi:MAG TPA: hypothetical protein VFJ58_15330 [Armatimonadota bacterium]|nr:hypothetical protein [Armatimonadota bacterium]
MTGGIAFYPWMVDWRSVSEILLGGSSAVVILYLWLRVGRDRKNDRPIGDHPPITDYAGLVQSGSNKVPTFLGLLMVVVSLWAIGYIINVHLHGGLDY